MNIKKYLNDIYKYNKKTIFIIFSIFIILLISLFVYINNKNENNDVVDVQTTDKVSKLVLFGKSTITLDEGARYVEPGYYAVTESGLLRTEDVIVTPDIVDTTKPGTYVINYVIDDKIEKRTIIVLEKEVGELSLTLKGESIIILNTKEEYQEPGFSATDSVLGDITDKVTVTGNIDTNIPGTYELIYEIKNDKDEKITKTRTIIVNEEQTTVDISTNISKEYINQNVIATIKVTGDNFSYIRYPDNTVSKNKISTYTITKNGYYEFYIYDNNLNYTIKTLNVTTIDKNPPTGTCNATIKNGVVNINVKADDNLSGIKEYRYYGNSKLLATKQTNSYSLNTNYTSFYVNVVDNASNIGKINCSIKNEENKVDPKYDYLEMHFIVSGHNDDAILIRTGNGTILIDSGRIGCADKVVPYLQNLGISSIDAIIGSHPHFNHIQAQSKVIENFKVKSSYYTVDLNTCAAKHYCEATDVLYIKDAIKKYNIPMNVTHAGDIVKIGDMTLYFIGPYTLNNTASSMQNYNSSIFILKYKNNTFMFTGDAPSSIFSYSKIKPYADKLGISLKVDVLKYPHHGNTNIEVEALNAAKPKYVIIPNYAYGQYPTSANKTKIRNIGATIYQNATDGNIVLISDGNNITVKTKQTASSYKR